jgi:hypothetical protein
MRSNPKKVVASAKSARAAADDHGMKQPVEQSSGEDRMTEEVAHSAKQVRSTALPDDCFRAGWSAKLRK